MGTKQHNHDEVLRIADDMEETARWYRHQIEDEFVTSDIIDDGPGMFEHYAQRLREASGAGEPHRFEDMMTHRSDASVSIAVHEDDGEREANLDELDLGHLRLIDAYDTCRDPWRYDGYADTTPEFITLAFSDDRRTSNRYEDAYGDDWDDSPYEHNAGIVYGRYVDYELVIHLGYDTALLFPCDGTDNSMWCREDMRDDTVPLFVMLDEKTSAAYAKDWRLDEFPYAFAIGLRDAHRFYFGDALGDVLGMLDKCNAGIARIVKLTRTEQQQ